MKIIGLLSGGKDSCYNLHLCKKEGHEIVCLANLHPPQGEHELDSFMYQSVGAEGVKAMAAAMQLPLYRKEIKGRALNTEANYSEAKGDEVEDLFYLLSTIKDQIPDVEGVSVGAIHSSYQKDRVDNVCSRLGLTPICLLWGRNQLELFDEMVQEGIDAIIIKVACAGLSTKHLGMTLKEARESLVEANKKYQAHVCGEGGEYETYVIDSPLHRSRISVDLCEAVLESDNAAAPVAYLKLTKVTLISKGGAGDSASTEKAQPASAGAQNQVTQIQTQAQNSQSQNQAGSAHQATQATAATEKEAS